MKNELPEIRAALKKKYMIERKTWSQMARESGVSPATIITFVEGSKAGPHFQVARKLAEYVGMEIDYSFEGRSTKIWVVK